MDYVAEFAEIVGLLEREDYKLVKNYIRDNIPEEELDGLIESFHDDFDDINDNNKLKALIRMFLIKIGIDSERLNVADSYIKVNESKPVRSEKPEKQDTKETKKKNKKKKKKKKKNKIK